MLAVRDLIVEIQGSRVLRGVSFEVKAGELVCIVGRNGAGKTTSFRTVMGFRRPAAGAIMFDGQSIVGLRPHQIARMGIGFSPEESEVFGELTVVENIALPTWTCPSPRSAQARIDDAFKVFPKLVSYRDRGGQALSGGERKMVSIARALALGPKLLLLDEPTSSLDPVATESIEALIRTLVPRLTVVIVTHNLAQARRVSDRTVFLNQGRLVEHGDTQQVFEHPAEEETAHYVGGRFG